VTVKCLFVYVNSDADGNAGVKEEFERVLNPTPLLRLVSRLSHITQVNVYCHSALVYHIAVPAHLCSVLTHYFLKNFFCFMAKTYTVFKGKAYTSLRELFGSPGW